MEVFQLVDYDPRTTFSGPTTMGQWCPDDGIVPDAPLRIPTALLPFEEVLLFTHSFAVPPIDPSLLPSPSQPPLFLTSPDSLPLPSTLSLSHFAPCCCLDFKF